MTIRAGERPDPMSNYATQSNPKGRFRAGTRIMVSGIVSPKADNGTFEIGSPYPEQRDGDAYLSWRRIRKDGTLGMGRATSALRGGRASKLEAWIEHGECRVIYEPSALVAVE